MAFLNYWNGVQVSGDRNLEHVRGKNREQVSDWRRQNYN